VIKLFLGILGLANFASAYELKGLATSMDGKQKIYYEAHNITLDEKGLNKKIETKYSNPDGKVFATMVSDFSKNPTVPIVVFEDERFKKKEELFYKDEKTIVLRSQVEGEKAKTAEFELKQGMVAAQGFNNFVILNFEALKSGTVPMKFGVLSERDFFSFKGSKRAEPSSGTVQFGIELSSFFLSLFLKELLVEYDVKTKYLVSYRGLSNLLTDEGKAQNVLIKYDEAKP